MQYLSPEELAELDTLLLQEPYDFIDRSFPEQEALMLDPELLKVVICTRRSGKSYAAGRLLFHTCMTYPDTSALYVGLTRQTAEEVMVKDIINPLLADSRVKCVENKSKLTWTFPNKSVFRLIGLDAHESEMDKVFGKKFKLVVIDEAALYHNINLRELIYKILLPAVTEQRGSIVMMGMPDDVKDGIFYESTVGQDPCTPGTWHWTDKAHGHVWHGHRWSAWQNHSKERGTGYIVSEEWKDRIAKQKAINPHIEETPLFQQAFLGKWVVDTDNLVYKYRAGRNEYEKLPLLRQNGWLYALGIDLGFEDDTSFTVVAWHVEDPVLYIVESIKEKGMDITAVAQRVKSLETRFNFEREIVDGSNKQAVEEMRRRHGLNLLAADKREKWDFIQVMNGDLIGGLVKLGPAAEHLKYEMSSLVKDPKSTIPKEHPGLPNHCCFVAGTMIATEHGPVPVEEMQVGMKVWTRRGLRPVSGAWCSGEREVGTVTFADGRMLTGTADHPIWAVGKGMTPLGEFHQKYSVASVLLAITGTRIGITTLSTISSSFPAHVRIESVFNLTVEDAHEYFANGVLVSNCDSALYVWRHTYSFMHEIRQPKPKIGTYEWQQAEEARMKAYRIEQAIKRQPSAQQADWRRPSWE